MNNEGGKLYWAAGLDNTQLRADGEQSQAILRSIGQEAVAQGNAMDSMLKKVAVGVGGLFAFSKAKEFISQVISVRGEIESLEISFRTLLGSQEKAAKMFGEIKKFAVSTPMQMKDLAAGAQQMLAFNIAADEVMPMLRAIGDISMGDSQKFQSLTLAFSQMSATGKLMGQDLLQMINAGFNPLGEISAKTGKSIGDLKEEMSAGAISADMVKEAFISATAEGGKFHNMLLAQSESINGAFSNLQGAVDDMMNDIGEQIQPVVTTAINGAMSIVHNYKPIAEVLGVIIATYGTYKAALMLNAAAEGIVAKATGERLALIEAEINAVGVQTAEEKLAADADLSAAVAKGDLTTTQALHILSLKEEAAARVASLRATAKQAAAEAAAATAARRAAGQRLQAAEVNAAAMRTEYQAALAKGDVFEIAVAKERMETAQSQVNAASQQYQAAATAETTAAKTATTAATTAQTAATRLDTLATETDTRAKGVMATATAKLRASVKRLYATMMAHPYALIAAAVVALTYAIYKVATAQSEQEKATARANDAIGKIEGSITRETSRLDELKEKLETAKKGSEEWKTAKQQIVAQFGQYFSGLDAEITKTGTLATTYDALTKAIRKSQAARALTNYQDTIKEDFDEEDELLADIQKKLQGKVLLKDKNGNHNPIALTPTTQKKWLEDISRFIAGEQVEFSDMMLDFVKNNRRGSTMGSTQILKAINQARRTNQANKQAQYDIGERYGMTKEEVDEAVTGKTAEKPDIQADVNYAEGLKAAQKRLDDANKALTAIKKNAQATKKQRDDAEAEVAAATKSLKEDWHYDVKGASGNKAPGIPSANDNTLAREAEERLRASEAYAQKLSDDAKQNEFAIAQARIEAMGEGLDKQLAQVDLNYQRLQYENQKREREMLADLAQARLREMEAADPYVFKKKDKDGKWQDDDVKRQQTYRDVLLRLSIKDLTPDQQRQLEEFGSIAARSLADGNAAALDKMVEQYGSYTQQRSRIEQEWIAKKDQLYQKDENGAYKKDKDGNRIFKEGVTPEMADEVDRQGSEALAQIDETFAQREANYQAWCDTIADQTLERLRAMLADVRSELDALQADPNADPKKLVTARAKANTLSKKVEREQAKADQKKQTKTPGRTLKEWEDLYKVLQDCEKGFEDLGEAIGGTVGDISKSAGQIATQALQMVNGIMQLAQWSVTATKMSAEGAGKAIQTVEKASVILAVVSAAAQIAASIINLFNNDNKKQEEIETLQARIDQLQWELDNADIRRLEFSMGTSSIDLVNTSLARTREQLGLAGVAANKFLDAFNAKYQRVSKNNALLAASAQKIADAYANVSYTADKALGAAKFDDSRSQLENIAKQQLLIQEQIDLERSKKKTDKSKITDWEKNIEELGQKAIAIINDMVEDIIGGSATDIAEQLSEAFFDAFENGKDYAQAWGDKVNEIVADILRQMMVQKFIEERIGGLFDRYKDKWFKNGQFLGIDTVVTSMSDFAKDLNTVGSDWIAIWEALPDQLKEMMKTTSDDGREASAKGIAQASQDSVDELNGRATAIQSHTYEINANTKLLLASTQQILRSVMNIEGETAGLGARIERMDANLREVKTSLSDIYIKGIRLKS